MGLESFRHGHAIHAVRGLADNPHVTRDAEHCLQPCPDDRVIVDEQDVNDLDHRPVSDRCPTLSTWCSSPVAIELERA